MDVCLERMLLAIEGSGLSDKEFQRQAGLPGTIIYDWRHHRNNSYRKYAGNVALLSGMSTDYLLGNTDEPRPLQGQANSAYGVDLLHGLTEENRKKALEYIALLLGSQK